MNKNSSYSFYEETKMANMAKLFQEHLAKTLEERLDPNLTPVQKRKLTKKLKNQIRSVYGFEASEHLDTVIKVANTNNWVLTAELLPKLLKLAELQKSHQTA